MHLVDSVANFIDTHRLIKPHSTIIVGLSGGPDSVFLLYALKNLASLYSISLIAGHLDHEWRSESHQDMLFCQQLCASWNITFKTQKASAIKLIKKTKGSQEELGRLLRRQFLESLAQDYNSDTIALGHHQDDQQETFFIRLIRGASITGLAAMYPRSGCYIRPLLSIYKQDIINYLDTHTITYIKDYTNELDTYLRNNIRLHVIPELKKADKRFDSGFEKTLFNIQEANKFLERYTQQVFNNITSRSNNTLWLDIKQFLAQDSFLYKPLLLLWLCAENVPFVASNSFFNEILRFFKKSSPGKHILAHSWSIMIQQNRATIAKLSI